MRKKRRGIAGRIVLVVLAAIILAGIGAYVLAKRYYPLRHVDIINKYAAQYDLAPELVCAVIHTESRFNENAVSSKGACGLMQLMEGTAYWLAPGIGIDGLDYKDIFDVETNIRLGCYYLQMLQRQFGGIETALGAYNAGSGNVSEWLSNPEYSSDGLTLDNIPFAETENYIKRVINAEKIYALVLKFAFLF